VLALALKVLDAEVARLVFLDDQGQVNLELQGGEGPPMGLLGLPSRPGPAYHALPDILLDERSQGHPLVLGGPRFRASVAVALSLPGAPASGWLQAFFVEPRSLTDAERGLLTSLARQVANEFRILHIDQELARVGQAFQAAREEAEASAREKIRLLAFVSHEFRTPMTGILGMASLVLGSALSAEQREMVETIASGSQTLLHLLNQMLDFAHLQIGHSELRLKDFDPVACVDNAVELVSASAAARGIGVCIQIDPSMPSRIRADEDKLRQVFLNLLGNAIKYTSGGVVQIELSASEDRLLAAVTDQGPGLPASQLATLFHPFTRGEASASASPGTGLGLAICKHIVELHGGKIEASNTPTGARFSFEIQVARASPAPRPLEGFRVHVTATEEPWASAARQRLRWWGAALLETPAPPADLIFHDGPWDGVMPPRGAIRLDEPLPRLPGVRKPLHWGKILPRLLRRPASQPSLPESAQLFDESLASRYPLRVLLVEDNPVNRRVLGKILERLGYHPVLAVHGQDALERRAEGAFDLVLMDLHMPVLDGIQATRALRALGDPVRIIAMTASASPVERERCLQSGMDGVLSKPILLDELVRTLKSTHGALAR
jgi:signal transduction histidine kinase/ActR/RegA family two-component response regulator